MVSEYLASNIFCHESTNTELGCSLLVRYVLVDCKLIHSALETAKKYYVTSKEGREFVDKNLAAVTNMMLSQSPRDLSSEKDRLGQSENDYVEKGIRFALQLINGK